MGFDWLAIGFDEVFWIALAFILGLAARAVRLPPLVGFLAAGFLLNSRGQPENQLIPILADLGITLLLFTVGLKLNLRTLSRPQVWGVGSIHMAVTVAVLGLVLTIMSISGVALFAGLTPGTAFLVAFALSFSSTVFVVKLLEDRSELGSLHGRLSIGILLLQDVVAVAFLAVSARQMPSAWALLLIFLWPLKYPLRAVLSRLGHGELLVLYGFLLAMTGAEIFELVGLKGDLGALVFGVLIASHPRAEELSKVMLGFKDLFLIGFFLSIGLSAPVALAPVLIGIAVTPLIFAKWALFFGLLTRFRLRARTALRGSLNLTNYSEFGLIVAGTGVANGWIPAEWLVVIAVALSLSFVVAALLNAIAEDVYANHRPLWLRYQVDDLIPDDRLLDFMGAKVVVIGMGGVGTGAYDSLRQEMGDKVIGVDIDSVTVANQRKLGRNVLRGDPTDADFWDRIQASHSLELVMLALPRQSTALAVLDRLSDLPHRGRVAAIARFPDEADQLRIAGAHSVFNMYSEAGAGFVAHTMNELPQARNLL
jgi:glutathione-regulated potassium-efflux system ancillary protein KefC